MTPFATRTHVLTRSKSLLTRGLQAAIVASPILVSAAPSQAATLTRTFTGFTEAFAPANWTVNTAGGGTAVFGNSNTTLTLTRPKAQGSTPAVGYLIDPDVLESFKPAGTTGAVQFVSGVFTYNYAWTSTSGVSATPAYNFAATEEFSVSSKLNPASGSTSSSGSRTSSALSEYQNFGFIHTKSGTSGTTGSSATGVISNFVFTATYKTVPGPLPLAGAAAAFAWSRRLRRRLKTAQASI